MRNTLTGAASRAAALCLALVLWSPASAQNANPVAGTTVRAADHGVVAQAEVDNSAALRRAFAAADQARRPGTLARVVLPCHEPFGTSGRAIGYADELFLPDSTVLSGCGGAELTRAVSPEGVAYAPVRPVARRGQRESRLRVLDDALDRVAPRLARAAGPQVERVAIRTAPGGAYTRVEDVVLDGNWEGNLAAYERRDVRWREDNLRNSPGWTGLAGVEHGGWNVGPRCDLGPPPALWFFARNRFPAARIDVVRTVVSGYGAAGLLGGACSVWALDTVLAENSLYNHVIYSTGSYNVKTAFPQDGPLAMPHTSWRNVTLSGFAWTHAIMGREDVENLVVHELTDSPTGRTGEALNQRGARTVIAGGYVDTRRRERTADGSLGRVVHTEPFVQSEGRSHLLVSGVHLAAPSAIGGAAYQHVLLTCGAQPTGQMWIRDRFYEQGVSPRIADPRVPRAAVGSSHPWGRTWQADPSGCPSPQVTSNAAIDRAASGEMSSDAREGGPPGPAAFGLGLPVPNPARGPVRLPYTLSEGADVSLVVYDALGREVARLADGWHEAGRHEATLSAGPFPAGVYVVRFVAGARSATRTVTVTK